VKIVSMPGLQNDFTTPKGTRDDIPLGVDQTISGLDFGFLVAHGHDHDHGDHGKSADHDH
jgi:hypothetical protein